MTTSIRLTVNGTAHQLALDPGASLLTALRGPLELSGPHYGCGLGQCGACNVLVDGRVVTACDTPLWSVADKSVTTAEGLGSPEAPHPLQTAFIAEQAMQCGYCISGILISAAALLEQNPRPDDSEIRAALDRNLCRCGAHGRIVRAVRRAALARAAT